MTASNPRSLIQRAQAQTQANRYAFVLRTFNAKLVNTIRATK